MNEKTRLLLLSFALIVAGGAIQWIDDELLHQSGFYMIAAGIVSLAFVCWYSLRGGDSHYSGWKSIDRVVPTTKSNICPTCGGHSIRKMTAVETTEFYGYDRFVIVRPMLCEECGRGFEKQMSNLGAIGMVLAASSGVLFGLGAIAASFVVAWMLANDRSMWTFAQIKLFAGAPILFIAGCWWVLRCSRVIVRSWARTPGC